MIHTASLVHDDVLDECSTRRGCATVNSTYGSRLAVLVGDFLFAQSSWALANLENMEVIKLISQVIADFANGEISQAGALFDTGLTLQAYMDKSFYKTATLIAASARSAAVFSGCDESVKAAMFEYGRRLGLAFQVVDDVLDFVQDEVSFFFFVFFQVEFFFSFEKKLTFFKKKKNRRCSASREGRTWPRETLRPPSCSRSSTPSSARSSAS